MVIVYKYSSCISYKSIDFDILRYDKIKYIYCSNNNLTNLPILPNSLKYLRCCNNKLIYLSILPTSLKYLRCYNNKLLNLPVLPDCLKYLYCFDNNIVNISNINKKIYNLNYDNGNDKVKFLSKLLYELKLKINYLFIFE